MCYLFARQLIINNPCERDVIQFHIHWSKRKMITMECKSNHCCIMCVSKATLTSKILKKDMDRWQLKLNSIQKIFTHAVIHQIDQDYKCALLVQSHWSQIALVKGLNLAANEPCERWSDNNSELIAMITSSNMCMEKLLLTEKSQQAFEQSQTWVQCNLLFTSRLTSNARKSNIKWKTLLLLVTNR